MCPLLYTNTNSEESNGKEFVTVQSKNGNYFYLVIDRDGDKENVYFLNLVDEADLLALIEEAPTETVPDPAPPTTEESEPPVVEDVKSETTGSSTRAILALVLVMGLISGGAFYYFKVAKDKKSKNTTPNLYEYEYEYEYEDEDDDELVLNEFNEEDFEDVEEDDNDELY